MDILSGEWRKLIMVNYTVPSKILQKYVPHGTHLCPYQDIYLLTLAGFLFEDVKVKGIRIPFNHTFEEINLRFYVEKDTDGEKGIVFINEIVSKLFFGFAANIFAREHYSIYPTEHEFDKKGSDLSLAYYWKYKGQHSIEADVIDHPRPIKPASEEEFVLKKHWSFTKVSNHVTSPMFVKHPDWLVYPLNEFEVKVDFKKLYGKNFGFLNSALPHSIQVAEGSPIQMKKMKNF
jgi:uncharacterized protein YqjF (DUF2071 family)